MSVQNLKMVTQNSKGEITWCLCFFTECLRVQGGEHSPALHSLVPSHSLCVTCLPAALSGSGHARRDCQASPVSPLHWIAAGPPGRTPEAARSAEGRLCVCLQPLIVPGKGLAKRFFLARQDSDLHWLCDVMQEASTPLGFSFPISKMRGLGWHLQHCVWHKYSLTPGSSTCCGLNRVKIEHESVPKTDYMLHNLLSINHNQTAVLPHLVYILGSV